MESKLHESQMDFKVRVSDILSDKKEEKIEVLKERYEKRGKVLQDRL